MPRKELDTEVDPKNLELVTRLRHELHQHPELSTQEVWTKEHLMNFLRTHTSLEIVDKGTWFYAAYRVGEDRTNIGFRADYDALPMEEYIDIPHGSRIPGVAHKCGHDGHSAVLAGLALEVDQRGADKNVFFLFQPAEETAEGAIQCVSFITDEKIHEIFAFHNVSGIPLNSIGVIDGTSNCASKGMIIRMEGTPSHASRPEVGRNPAYAIANIVTAIPSLISPDRYEGLVLCTVIQVAVGERAFGMSAHKGDLLLTIRALYEKEMDELQASLENLASSEARKYGLTVSFSYADEFPETVNHKESSDKIREACRRRGLQLIEREEASRGSEDFGYFTKLTKGAMFHVGNGVDYPDIHTPLYDFPDETIETAVRVFKTLIDM